jgi:hypothetical protein
VTVIVVEEGIAARAPAPGDGALVLVPRRRRRRSWQALDADDVVPILAGLGRGALLAARPAAADPGAASLPTLAGIMGLAVARLPADDAAAAATVAVASGPGFAPSDLRRAVEVLAVFAADGEVAAALRPAVLARWAVRAWRPCEACPRGGPAGRRCGSCGGPVAGAPA